MTTTQEREKMIMGRISRHVIHSPSYYESFVALTDENNRLKKALSEKEEQIHQLSKLADNMADKVSEKDKEIERLTIWKSSYDTYREEALKEISQLREENKALRERIERIRTITKDRLSSLEMIEDIREELKGD